MGGCPPDRRAATRATARPARAWAPARDHDCCTRPEARGRAGVVPFEEQASPLGGRAGLAGVEAEDQRRPRSPRGPRGRPGFGRQVSRRRSGSRHESVWHGERRAGSRSAMIGAPCLPSSPLDRLRKSYGALTAVAEVSFEVDAGRDRGLLGPNGAGKSTTVGMIAGLLTPDAGEVRINGAVLAGDTDPRKRAIGARAPGPRAVRGAVRAREPPLLRRPLRPLRPRARRRHRGRRSISSASPSGPATRCKTFSGGMKRRLNLAWGLVHDPRCCCSTSPPLASIHRAATRSSTTSRR